MATNNPYQTLVDGFARLLTERPSGQRGLSRPNGRPFRLTIPRR